jgi:hypothetical protein
VASLGGVTTHGAALTAMTSAPLLVATSAQCRLTLLSQPNVSGQLLSTARLLLLMLWPLQNVLQLLTGMGKLRHPMLLLAFLQILTEMGELRTMWRPASLYCLMLLLPLLLTCAVLADPH